ncbi:CAP domain-containing protein [Tuberibacillus sp. Marseille-P3662]|uniref:CAP domain-containing protein n=1 Tax=Tuberibacillus sp. Marseille-P3662 TaxID=1965358 RepID=UPI000A1C8A20|nr:CAP domain-containing protein [Tuberibacillus sp. Marseille-P3662]
MKKSIITVMLVFILSACNTQDGQQDSSGVDDHQYNSVNYNDDGRLNDNRDNERFNLMEDGHRHDDLSRGEIPGEDREQDPIDQDHENHDKANQGNQKNNQDQSKKNPTKNPSLSDFQKKVIKLTNQERTKRGLSKIKADPQVSKVAQKKAKDMSQNHYFSHTSPQYGSPFQMMKDAGIDYQAAAENIAKGQDAPKVVMEGWMNSAGHRKNILKKGITHIGVGYAQGQDGPYWSQMFIEK